MGTFTEGTWVAVNGAVIVYDKEKWKANGIKTVANVEKAQDRYLIAAAPDMYNALWEAVELSDRTLPPSGRTAECQRVYDLCRAALAKAEGE